MSNTAQQAYDAIKKLEADNVFPLATPTKTVHVGNFNAATGTFQYSVHAITIIETDTGPNGKPVILKFPAGQIKLANVVNLHLQFSATNLKGPLTVSFEGTEVTAAQGVRTVTVDVGEAQSVIGQDGKITTFEGFLRSGDAETEFRLQIIRLPVVTGGAFTLPAVPIALVYAPPPGSQKKNYAEYSSMNSSSRKIATTVSGGTTTKTSDAYSTSDFIDKISGLASSIQGFLGAFGIVGEDPLKKAGASTILGLNLLSGILSSTTTSTSTALTTTTEHDLQITDTDTTTTGTPAGLGPGVGDRFVYLRNVKVGWVIGNGALSFSVLGDEGIRSFAAQQLISDAKAIATSGGTVTAGPVTKLDGPTLQMLLNLDPFVGNATPTLSEPRFVLNDPPIAAGSGTDPTGDVFNVSHDISVTDTTTQTSVTTTVTDYKPGWLDALFGDNQAREDQATFGYTSAVTNATDQKQSATVFFFAKPTDPPYAVGLYFDRLFGTFAFTPADGKELRVPGHAVATAVK